MNNMNKLLPIAIMAHNEEKVISKAIKSALSQDTPVGYSSKIVVVANACTDRTEDIVRGMAENYPNRVQLVSIREKGKTRAINEAIKLFKEMSRAGFEIPYVIFLDADCEIVGREALPNFVKRFESNPLLCAISANCVPDVCFNSRQDVVSEVYRAIHSLAQSVKINSISGMCYAIRFEILKRIDFPDFQFAEDMYISSRLNGRFYKDMDVKIAFKTPADLRTEINRRARQEVSSHRYREYYSYLKKNGVRVELFHKSLGDDYRWGRAIGDSFFRAWLNLKSARLKLYAISCFLIRLLVKISAYKKIKQIRINEDLDYWKVGR